jgi:hypothetical protein
MSYRLGFFLIHFLLLPFCAAAQLFLPITDDVFGVPVKFNADSVRLHHIKTISASIRYKPDERKIDDKGLKEFYRFDSLGRISFYWRTRVHAYQEQQIEHPAVYRKGKRIKAAWTESVFAYTYDTVFVYYYYDNLQRLTCLRQCDQDFYRAWYYIYNEDGTLARRTLCRETNLGQGHHNFRMGVQTILSQEDFSYQRFSKMQIKQLCLNDEGKPYKETMIQLDENGRPLEYREAYTAGGIRIISTWKYDATGRTTGITYSSNAGGDFTEETVYVYDSLGRIASLKRFRADQLKDEFSYLYNGTDPIAYAYINRRHLEMGIDIVKMEIGYW